MDFKFDMTGKEIISLGFEDPLKFQEPPENQAQEEGLVLKTNELKIYSYSEGQKIGEYLKKISKFPVLTEEQEKTLLLEFFQRENKKAGQFLVNCHLRLVVKIAMKYKNYHSSLFDLIAEGNLGLLKALKNFSIEKQVRFSTYAMIWIKASIREFLVKSVSSIKAITTTTQKKMLFSLSSAKKHLGLRGESLTLENEEKLSKMLSVSKEELRKHEQMMYATRETSTNDVKFEENDSEAGDFISSSNETLEGEVIKKDNQNVLKQKLELAMSELSPREVEILKYRILMPEKYTLAELSTKFQVSKERIRQIQEGAVKKLKNILASDKEILKFL